MRLRTLRDEGGGGAGRPHHLATLPWPQLDVMHLQVCKQPCKRILDIITMSSVLQQLRPQVDACGAPADCWIFKTAVHRYARLKICVAASCRVLHMICTARSSQHFESRA